MTDVVEASMETADAAATSPEALSSASSASPTDSPTLPSKRPSPWRGKTTPLQGTGLVREPRSPKPLKVTTEAAVAAKAPVVKVAPHKRLLQDVVTIRIPMNITADLGIALRQSREKRIKGLHAAFPSLKPDAPTKTVDEQAEAKDDGAKGEATTDKDDDAEPKKSPTKRSKNVPQPHEYGSIVDYLEAKYVQGVMVDTEGDEMMDDDEGQGSVYSQDSFFDDTDLQRTVAEQVLAHTTTTKLELQDDDAFFVNVGNLEVEETDLTQDKYDPLEDTNEKTAPKRKRKKAATTDSVKSNGTKKSKTASVSSKASKASTAAKKTKVVPKDENEKPNKKETVKKGSPAELEKLAEISAERKAVTDKEYDSLAEFVKNATAEELPRRKTKEKVTITCPPDKKAGDSIMFANPHVPGQKLKVKIPMTVTGPGGVFKVTVPVAPAADDDDTDHNKFTRAFYDTLDDFVRAYDHWIDAEQGWRRMSGDKEYAGFLEKRLKFDKLIAEFPKDLKTSVDKAYIQKILRRARQNKHKREKTMQMQVARVNGKDDSESGSDSDDDDAETEKKQEVKTEPKVAKSPEKKPKPTTPTATVTVPQLATKFPTMTFNREDFM